MGYCEKKYSYELVSNCLYLPKESLLKSTNTNAL